MRLPLGRVGVSARRPIPVVRQLVGLTAILRWIGLVAGGVFGLVASSRTPALVAIVILAVAAYNSWSMLAIRRADDSDALRIARAVTLLDAVCCILFIAAFTDFPGGAQSTLYVPIMIEAVAYDRTEGAAVSLAIFIVGVVAINGARVAFSHGAFAWTTLVSWSLILAVIAASLVIFDRVTASEPATREGFGGGRDRESQGESSVHLSPREQEVLRLIAQGNSNAMIAQRLHLSETTVKTYVETLLLRLGARNRAEAVAAASRLDLL